MISKAIADSRDVSVDIYSPHSVASLQLVSKKFNFVCRDNILWRTHCFEAIHGYNQASAVDSSSPDQPLPETLLAETPREKTKHLASQWDPSYSGEAVSWYAEYVSRQGPVSVEWLYPSTDKCRWLRAARGIGIMKDFSYEASDMIVSPLEDGSVCLWNLNRSISDASRSLRGTVAGESSPRLLFDGHLRDKNEYNTFNVKDIPIGGGEGVSIDSYRKVAYIATGSRVNEVNLATMQVISQITLPWSVFALSQETHEYPAPLTIGTSDSLQLYDWRSQRSIADICSARGTDDTAVMNPFDSHPVNGICSTLLHEPGPLSILHPPTPNVNNIIVAGRFPSLLLYDRRYLGTLQGSSHSGARLDGVTAIPTAPTPAIAHGQDLSRHHTLVACGEYKGRGSLEFFALPFQPEDLSEGNEKQSTPISLYRNRQNASASKLLSVANHGTRIVFSDADGIIRWMERDGRSCVRSFHLGDRRYYRQAPSSCKSSISSSDRTSHSSSKNMLFECDVAQKILPTGFNTVEDSELLLWSGEQVGRLRFVPSNYEEYREGKESEVEAQEREHADIMRRSLINSANELNWMQRFGYM